MANRAIPTAPGVVDDIDEMIASVQDDHVRDTMSMLLAENRRFRLEYNRQMECFSGVLFSVAADVKTLASRANSPPLPQFISAVDRDPLTPDLTATGSDTQPSSLTDRSEFASCDSRCAIVLKCLFCPHYHAIEKSHHQHYSRLRDRFLNSEPYSGKCRIPLDHWIFRSFGGAGQDPSQIVSNFMQKYLSFLASGNEKNINPERAAQLCAWLESIPRS